MVTNKFKTVWNPNLTPTYFPFFWNVEAIKPVAVNTEQFSRNTCQCLGLEETDFKYLGLEEIYSGSFWGIWPFIAALFSMYFPFKLQYLGLEETKSGVWKLLMAVAVHSSAVAFCIGSELVAKGVSFFFSFSILHLHWLRAHCQRCAIIFPELTLIATKTVLFEDMFRNSPFFSGVSKKSVVLYIGILRYDIRH